MLPKPEVPRASGDRPWGVLLHPEAPPSDFWAPPLGHVVAATLKAPSPGPVVLQTPRWLGVCLCPQIWPAEKWAQETAGLGTASLSPGGVWVCALHCPLLCLLDLPRYPLSVSKSPCLAQVAHPGTSLPLPSRKRLRSPLGDLGIYQQYPNPCLYRLIQAHKLLCDLGQVSASVLNL